jgi:putative addiction module killer protein
MEYEIETTNIFEKWLSRIKDPVSRARILSRIDHVQLGNFGDHKALGEELFELRFFFSAGFRVYYTVRGAKIVLLLCGGDKSSQSKDIDRARTIMDGLE